MLFAGLLNDDEDDIDGSSTVAVVELLTLDRIFGFESSDIDQMTTGGDRCRPGNSRNGDIINSSTSMEIYNIRRSMIIALLVEDFVIFSDGCFAAVDELTICVEKWCDERRFCHPIVPPLTTSSHRIPNTTYYRKINKTTTLQSNRRFNDINIEYGPQIPYGS